MAAPKGVAHGTASRTTWPPTEGEPLPLTPNHRKFPFESRAADPVAGAAVAEEPALNQGNEGCGQELQEPGAQPCRLVTMTSVVKTVYTLQPPAVQSSGVPAGFWQVKAADTAMRRNIRKSCKPPGKQKPEEELKDKNQLLEAINKQLHQKLTETQGELKDLTQKVELLEKFQDNCLAILESKGLNPVLGCETLASQRESAADHTDSMLLLETLQDELKFFNETAKKQMEELQALKVKLKMKEEERARFLEQQTLCNNQVNDFTAALEEMEQLLEM
ncbi:PREDICTED: small kinetochore-associated protein [Odobenus rosmarus divergens]|uniref:Small kinetochore-associated protein n=1 Tax=Odobenus rosmarus divergens TaxID=9708 RepID=A0A2U3VY52_ODORO|nr:PREDICTED: small kinetochore-associated protein [Odobenus rosmarus divergens]